MFSGKSEELIRRIGRASTAAKRVQVFKPALDTRYSAGEIVTHGDLRMRAQDVSSAREIVAKLDAKTQVIGIDEANFFDPELTEVVDQLANSGRQVIVAGLDTDFLGRPFPPMPDLLAISESITKRLAICARCGAPAKHSQRLVESDKLILVGAAEAYGARCRRCFQPGVPRQDLSIDNAEMPL